MVFPGMKEQKEILFQSWGMGGICEAISYNKVKLTPLSDTKSN